MADTDVHIDAGDVVVNIESEDSVMLSHAALTPAEADRLREQLDEVLGDG